MAALSLVVCYFLRALNKSYSIELYSASIQHSEITSSVTIHIQVVESHRSTVGYELITQQRAGPLIITKMRDSTDMTCERKRKRKRTGPLIITKMRHSTDMSCERKRKRKRTGPLNITKMQHSTDMSCERKRKRKRKRTGPLNITKIQHSTDMGCDRKRTQSLSR